MLPWKAAQLITQNTAQLLFGPNAGLGLHRPPLLHIAWFRQSNELKFSEFEHRFAVVLIRTVLVARCFRRYRPYGSILFVHRAAHCNKARVQWPSQPGFRVLSKNRRGSKCAQIHQIEHNHLFSGKDVWKRLPDFASGIDTCCTLYDHQAMYSVLFWSGTVLGRATGPVVCSNSS